MSVKATVLPVKKLRPTIEPVPFALCDHNATESAKVLAAYLSAVSAAGYVLYGHQNDLHRKAGSLKGGFSDSDTRDITEEYAAITGLDALSLTGTEHGCWNWDKARRIESAVKLSLRGAALGGIISLSAHMPNFELLWQRETGTEPQEDKARGSEGAHAYEGLPAILSDGSTNYSGYTPNDLRGTVVRDVLPGQKLHALFTGYLDLVCDYFDALGKKGLAALWRPFHENTGGWFWWGCNTCTPEEFIALWRYTWHYMREERGVHNIIWAYSPGSEPKTKEAFLERYPGDEYVDMVGFDMYQQYPAQAHSFWEEFEAQCALVSSFAHEHSKLFAVTETGISHPNNKALLEKDNEEKDWYIKVFDIAKKYGASYFLLWANFTARGAYYSPYVTQKKRHHEKTVELHGHEMLDGFIRFYNNDYSLFSRQTPYYGTLSL